MRKPESNNQVCNMGARPAVKVHLALPDIGVLHRYLWGAMFQVFGTRHRYSRYVLLVPVRRPSHLTQ